MTQSRPNAHWLGRIVGAIIVTGASYALLWFGDSWGLSDDVKILISIGLGTLFLVFGGKILDWIDEIDLWS